MTNQITTPLSYGSLVVRSAVPPGKPYGDYRQSLRKDFLYSCAYCRMTEAEAQAIRFTIDHYEPQNARPDLVNIYDNLMYCCDECNTRKGDRCPPPDARTRGIRFFRPDTDYWHEHFKKQGYRLEKVSNVGGFSIDALDLNRAALRKLREIRERLFRCDEYIAEGISALLRFKIDRLPPHIRGRAVKHIRDAVDFRATLTGALEQILSEFARSPLLDVESEDELRERGRERQARLKEVEDLYPGTWRASRGKRN